jgi:GNAT superfamily N-acetyltransferase
MGGVRPDLECKALASLDAQLETFAEQADESSAELQTTDIDDLTKFLVSVFGGELGLWHDWFRHWWALNPAWDPALPRGWLMRSTAGRLIAFTANIPFSYVVDGTAALCCATGSTAVDPDWRGLGLAKVVGRRFLDQAHGDLLVGAESTDVAYRLWRSLGMESLEEHWLQANSRILADGATLARAVSQRAGLPDFVGRAAGTCLALLLDSPVLKARRSKSLSIMTAERFAGLDADDVELCRASQAATYARRDVRTLNWLYFGTRYLKSTRAVFIARSGTRLVGYLAMKQWRGHSYYLLECRCRDADPEIARELICAAREFARRKGAQSVIVRAYTPMIASAIPASASIQVRRPPATYCYKIRTGRIDVGNWEATPGDGDVSVN